MEIFIDSASIAEIREAREMGVLDGVTTNPSLIKIAKQKSNKRFKEIVDEILVEFKDIPVSVEVLSTDYEGMLQEAEDLRKDEKGHIYPNIIIKLPCIKAGLKACHKLSQENIKTNLTLCFQPMQALLMAKAGAEYISPFVGRMDDQSEDGMNLVANIKMIYTNYNYKTKILVASIRNPIHLLTAARMGADCATVPLSVIGQLLKHPLTDIGLEKFLQDSKNIPN